MISIYNFFILLCTFIIYLHIIKHITFPCFENIYEVDYINNSNIQESCNKCVTYLLEMSSKFVANLLQNRTRFVTHL